MGVALCVLCFLLFWPSSCFCIRGFANQSLNFVATSDYVELSSGQGLGLNTIKTIEAWINPDDCGSSTGAIYGTASQKNMFFCSGNRIRFQTEKE